MPAMRACVAVPPLRDFYFTPHRFSALGAVVVMQLLEQAGVEVSFYNFPLQKKKSRQIPLPGEMKYLKPYIIPGESSRISYFVKYQHFGPPVDECAGRIASASPGVIFLACFAFCYAGQTLALARALKKVLPLVPVVCGGAGVSAYPGYFLRDRAVDFVIAGEAEVSVPPFIRYLKNEVTGASEVPGLYYKKGGVCCKPEYGKSIEEKNMCLPLSVPLETKRAYYISLMLTRGCKKKCRFCVNFNSSSFRQAPFPDVCRALDRLAENIADRDREVRVNFEDDNLLYCEEYFFSILAEFKKRFSKLSFYAENGLDYTLLDEELTGRLVEAGMRQFNISLGTVDPLLVKQESRILGLTAYRRILDRLSEKNIPVISYFICGFKNESKENIVKTLLLLGELDTLIGISLFYPVPGLPGFQDLKVFDNQPPWLCSGSAAWPWNRSLATPALVTAFRLSRFLNLCKAADRSYEEERLLERIFSEKKLYTVVKKKNERSLIAVPGMDREMVTLFFKGFSPTRIR